MTITRTQFQEMVQNAIDSTGVDAVAGATVDAPRWNHVTINAVGGNVMQEEWSGILNQTPYYRFATINTTTDANGCIAISNLTTGSGDTKQTFYRVLSGFTDGTYLYREVDFRNVPMATITNYQNPWDYLYYLAGSNFQLLPVSSGTAITTYVNWTPPRVDQLSGDGVSLDFPDGAEMILVWQTAAKLLAGKGGAEAAGAAVLSALADDARKNLYGSIARQTTRPSYALYPDTAMMWGGAALLALSLAHYGMAFLARIAMG